MVWTHANASATYQLVEFHVRVQVGVAIFQTKNWPEKEAWKSDILETIEALSRGGHDTRTLVRTLVLQAITYNANCSI